MRLRRRQRGNQALPLERRQEGIRQDLAGRGVSDAFSAPLAEHIEARRAEIDEEGYGSLLDGIALAYSAHRADCDAIETRTRDLDEIQRLMQGFAGELRKLEEGLRIVSAYVLRMHDKAQGERDRVMH